MRLVHAAVTRRDLRQLDHLGGGRERAGDVEETGAQSERAVEHAVLDERLHLRNFLRRRLAIDVAHDLGTDRALTDEAADVHRLLQRVEPGEKRRQRHR